MKDNQTVIGDSLSLAMMIGETIKANSRGPLEAGGAITILTAAIATCSYSDCVYKETIETMHKALQSIDEDAAKMLGVLIFGNMAGQAPRKATDPQKG